MSEPIHSYWDFIEPYWNRFDIYNDGAGFERSIEDAPRPVVLVYAAHFCLSEVRNGGFLQFFFNNTGVLAPEAIAGYEAIGMPTLVRLLKEAASALGSPYPRDRADRWDALLHGSGHTVRELEEKFKDFSALYRAFAEATKALPFDSLEKQSWKAAKTENGGFDNAATRYAQNPYLTH